jgi:hypothetical protein
VASIILAGVVTRLRRAAVLALAIGLVAGAWRPCAGWEATAEARMSCCLRHGACATHKVSDGAGATTVHQSDADACCAGSERQDASQPSVAVVLAPALVPLAGRFAEAPPVPTPSFDWHRPPPRLASRRLPTHLLLSVFLI